jgi:hypothetical protein
MTFDMRIKPSKLLIIVCGSSILIAALFEIIGVAARSAALKRIGAICFLIAVIVSSLPLALGLGYVFCKKMRILFKGNPHDETRPPPKGG